MVVSNKKDKKDLGGVLVKGKVSGEGSIIR